MRYRINSPKIIYETIDNEVVIIDFDTGNYYGMNNLGSIIWQFIESGYTANEIVGAIINQYQSSREVVMKTVDKFLCELEQEGLITPERTEKSGATNGLESCVDVHTVTAPCSFEAPILRKYTDMQELLLLDPIHEVDEAGWPIVESNHSRESEDGHKSAKTE
ncbi:hypothetical protein ES708_07205 [subsurface metagenome]